MDPWVNPKKYKNLRVSGFFLFLLIIPISNLNRAVHEGFILFLGSHIGKESKSKLGMGSE
jgi:hypothetical protein